MQSLVISRTWQGPRPQPKPPSLCGAAGLGFPVCHRHFSLPPSAGRGLRCCGSSVVSLVEAAGSHKAESFGGVDLAAFDTVV